MLCSDHTATTEIHYNGRDIVAPWLKTDRWSGRQDIKWMGLFRGSFWTLWVSGLVGAFKIVQVLLVQNRELNEGVWIVVGGIFICLFVGKRHLSTWKQGESLETQRASAIKRTNVGFMSYCKYFGGPLHYLDFFMHALLRAYNFINCVPH